MAGGPLLEIEGLTKHFGKVAVADHLSFTVGDGEAVGIVGPNGAGKTSLFGLISGDLKADAGEIRLAGKPVGRLDASARCRLGVGRTYQVPRPFEQMSVFENVLVAAQQGGRARRREASDLAESVLETTGLYAVANVAAGRLGLLQRKRLELARALSTRPRLLLLDEVAGGLTDPEVAELIGIVREAHGQGVTVVWIEHVVRALVSLVDRLICLASGAVIGDGPPSEVLAMAGVREVFLGSEPDAGHLGAAGHLRSGTVSTT